MADYRFLTTWLLDSPREPVFDAIYDQASWPSWWRGVEEAAEIQPGEESGVGTVARMVWKSLLPYRVEFEVTTTHVERPHLLQADAVGELTGVGRWRLYEEDGVTAVLYEWNVATTPGLDEPSGAGRPPGLRVESRLGDGARRRGDRESARLPPAGQRLRRAHPLSFLPLALSSVECQARNRRSFRPYPVQDRLLTHNGGITDEAEAPRGPADRQADR